MSCLKVYEFKAELSVNDAESFECYTEGLRVLWNKGHSLYLESQQQRWRVNHVHPLPPSFKLRWWRGKVRGSGIFMSRNGGKCCPIAPQSCEDPQKLAVACRSRKNWHCPELDGVPSVYRDAIIGFTLKQSWKNCWSKTHTGKQPRFKGKGDRPRILINLNGGTTAKVTRTGNNAWVKMPGFDAIRIKGYFKRFPNGLKYGRIALVKDGDEFYLQVTAEFTPVEIDRSPTRQIGVDPGVKLLAATSEGACIKPRKMNQRRMERLKRLQRKASRQYEAAKKQGNRYPFSKGWQKTQLAIANIHTKERRSRKAFNANVADGLGRFDVALEGTRLQNMTRRPKAQAKEDGKGYAQNGAKRKAGLNRALLGNALGQLRQLTEARCKSRNRVFIKTADGDVRYSSRRCHCCGEMGARPTQELFACQNEACRLFGEPQNADVNAAKNHRIAGFNLPREATPVQSGKVKRVKSETAAQAERSVKPAGGSRDSMPEPCMSGKDLGAEKAHKHPPNTGTPRKQGRSRKPKPQVLANPPTEPRQLSFWDDGAIGA